MRLIVKRTLDDDGDLNVTQVRREIATLKEWVQLQNNQEKAFWESYTDRLSKELSDNN